VNVGSGREISIGELVELLGVVTGNHPEVVTDEDRLRPAGSEVDRLLCDHSAATELTGWMPQVSLEEGLALTVEWVRENLDALAVDGYQV
jgi:nucleoside-diphosphate-sugar epimerase